MPRFDSRVVPDEMSTVFPTAYYHVKVTDAKEDHFGENHILGWALRADILAPQEQEGMTFFINLFGGRKDDPEAETTKTQKTSRGLKLLRRICLATGVEFDQDTEVICEELRDQEFVVLNRTKPNDDFNNWADAWAVGDAEPGLLEPKPTAAAKPAATRNGAGRQAARPTTTRTTPAAGFARED